MFFNEISSSTPVSVCNDFSNNASLFLKPFVYISHHFKRKLIDISFSAFILYAISLNVDACSGTNTK